MESASSLFRRLRSAIFYLGAGFLLVRGARALLRWLRTLASPRQADPEPGKKAEQVSVAVLIDGENIAMSQVERVIAFALKEAGQLGEVTVRRVYGNCSMFNQANTTWNDASLRFEVEQVHLPRPTVNKNTADIALAISAIELAKDGRCNHFCLVTSDSDFTPLARRLRELKCYVLGIGDKRTPATLIKACHKFVYTDYQPGTSTTTPPRHSRSQPSPAPTNGPSGESQSALPEPPHNSSQAVVQVLKAAYLDAARVRGDWVLLSRLGLSLRRLYPDFKATTHAEDLSALIRRYPDMFDFEKRPNGHPQMRLKA